MLLNLSTGPLILLFEDRKAAAKVCLNIPNVSRYLPAGENGDCDHFRRSICSSPFFRRHGKAPQYDTLWGCEFVWRGQLSGREVSSRRSCSSVSPTSRFLSKPQVNRLHLAVRMSAVRLWEWCLFSVPWAFSWANTSKVCFDRFVFVFIFFK